MEKIYLVIRVVDESYIIKSALRTKEAAKAYKRFMDAEGQKTAASWIEEIPLLPGLDSKAY